MHNHGSFLLVIGIASLTATGCALSEEDAMGAESDVPTFQGQTAEEIAAKAENDGGEKGTAELVSEWIPCGKVQGFPTWTFWGYTTAEAVNHTPGTTIRLSYQAGAGATEIVEVANFASWGARWWGMTLWVTYLGYYDSQGYYRNCIQSAPSPAEAPQLVVQTY